MACCTEIHLTPFNSQIYQGDGNVFGNYSHGTSHVLGSREHGYQVSEAAMETESYQNSERGTIVTVPSDEIRSSIYRNNKEQSNIKLPAHSPLNGFHINPSRSEQYVQAMDNVPQIPDAHRIPNTNTDQSNRSDLGNGSQPVPLTESGICNSAAEMKYPQYEDEMARFDTFRNWPASYYQTPHQLVEAGFFYTKFMDWVKCFYCGIGLKNWSATDDPMTEHAKWSPRCQFVVFVKGEEFIQAGQNSSRPPVQQIANTAAADSERSPLGQTGRLCEKLPNMAADMSQASKVESERHLESKRQPQSERHPELESYPESTLKKNPLLTEAAQKVLHMGYIPKHVNDAVTEVLKYKAWNEMTSNEIVHVLSKQGRTAVQNVKTQTAKQAKDRGNYLETDVSSIESENRELKDKILCKICCEDDVSIVFLPCGHLVSCAQCAPAIQKCAICRRTVSGTVRVSL